MISERLQVVFREKHVGSPIDYVEKSEKKLLEFEQKLKGWVFLSCYLILKVFRLKLDNLAKEFKEVINGERSHSIEDNDESVSKFWCN